MLSQYKNPILVQFDALASLANVETALNNALSGNPGYSLVGVLNENYYVLDEDWGIPNPIHSVVLVSLTTAPHIQLPSVLSGNPGYHLMEIRFFAGVPDYAFVLGSV